MESLVADWPSQRLGGYVVLCFHMSACTKGGGVLLWQRRRNGEISKFFEEVNEERIKNNTKMTTLLLICE